MRGPAWLIRAHKLVRGMIGVGIAPAGDDGFGVPSKNRLSGERSVMDRWKDEFKKLRAIALEGQLTEAVKWGWPCFTFQDRNIVLIHGFKEYCALLFFKGALMQDPNGILIQQTENVQAGRQVRFTALGDILAMEPVLKAYLLEAIEVEKSGRKINKRKTEDFPVPDEFTAKLEEMPVVKAAFEALTPGRRNAYLLHFSGAKQSQTRKSRIEKCIPRILEGKGLDD